MGADLAVTTTRGGISLNNFNDTVLLKMKLRAGHWAVFGRVAVTNGDPDRQYIRAALLRNVNVVIDSVQSYGDFVEAEVMALQATLSVDELETIVLSCSTYKGIAEQGSLIAIKVDAIEVQ
jgi:hypothetical protein